MNLDELAHNLNTESVVIALMILSKRPEIDISISDSVISIKTSSIFEIEKLNFLLEMLCHIPFAFEFDSLKQTYIFNFKHLQNQINHILLAFGL